MNERTLRALEFNEILTRLKEYAISDKTKQQINIEMFQTLEADVIKTLNEVDDALTMLRYRPVEMAGIQDITAYVKRAKIGSVLTVNELLAIKQMLNRKDTLIGVFNEFYDKEIELETLSHYERALPTERSLYNRIVETVDETGVLDHASSTLLSIRKKISREEAGIRTRLNDIMRKHSKKLSDSLVTMRNNRYVLPVKADAQGEIKGIIHDVSTSGLTVYIEPMAIVEISNKIQHLREDEKNEVSKILAELTGLVAEHEYDLLQIDEVLHIFDLIFAKAKYGMSYKGTIPAIGEDERIHLVNAFHPLIDINQVVKNDIFVDRDTKGVIITGPNTGGKTVTIKTIGLSVMMAQCGIPIPALDGSRLRLFESIYADIGDEQSIEQSLSTFSSHLTNIADILNRVDEKSLVILDELGAGTDPEEGAALAISILEFLLDRHVTVISTTHYPELKSFSYGRTNTINASMEFDLTTLSPTYRLLMGIPGKSNAFEISEKLGLNRGVIDRARALSGRDNYEINEMIGALERHTTLARDNELETERLLKNVEILKQELEDYKEKFEREKNAMIEAAEEKANEIIKESEQKAKDIIDELELMKTLGADSIEQHKLIEAKKSLSDSYYHKDIKKDVKNVVEETLNVGDEVDVLTYGQKGVVIDIEGNDISVQMGIIKMKVKKDELKKRKQEKKKAPTLKRVSRMNVSNSLDLRGERYEDAMIRLDRYLDQVVLSNLTEVEIIHGKGTGALQKGVQQHLKRHSKVAKFRGGLPSEGGFGVTIVTMK
ncbi:endonuclease MutS2 [Phocicoccus pinnipedialis]|uniref:Endonuclease MutS2 n=1 Tax=Phocicoccus pinnipedialis TaxID=110845 RepID=A0A6V7REG2_9BACL|nr:endonuclease MutS2 [Jeotgalicoccus pinnipedialis]MBP1939470.1 DNA mismatch repair protein MutS2 [Jeotgalicoccus pinnipedialis]CAD2075268.1 Endonuclease MutS2 [Jeotgalicoccus pinnipedialis]